MGYLCELVISLNSVKNANERGYYKWEDCSDEQLSVAESSNGSGEKVNAPGIWTD